MNLCILIFIYQIAQLKNMKVLSVTVKHDFVSKHESQDVSHEAQAGMEEEAASMFASTNSCQ